jgi:hypothetical protein
LINLVCLCWPKRIVQLETKQPDHTVHNSIEVANAAIEALKQQVAGVGEELKLSNRSAMGLQQQVSRSTAQTLHVK